VSFEALEAPPERRQRCVMMSAREVKAGMAVRLNIPAEFLPPVAKTGAPLEIAIGRGEDRGTLRVAVKDDGAFKPLMLSAPRNREDLTLRVNLGEPEFTPDDTFKSTRCVSKVEGDTLIVFLPPWALLADEDESAPGRREAA